MTLCLGCSDEFSAEEGLCESCGGQAVLDPSIETLIRELLIELDGVNLPGSAAAILNRLEVMTGEDRFL